MKPQIVIAKPCHENWNKMTPQEQGRHCAVCSKVVKDFTKMKTDDIVNTLRDTSGEVCGRIAVKNLTPVNQNQKLYFWLRSVFYRRAIYPLMALLGVGLINKRAQAQVVDYNQVKGRMAVRDYHTNTKKVTIVVKSNDKGAPIADAGISIFSGIKNHAEIYHTDANGRLTMELEPTDIISEDVEIDIDALGYEHKRITLKLIKDAQTIEVRMEDEVMMMGEMMYVPEKINHTPKAELLDSLKKLEIVKCSVLTIQKLPEADETLTYLEIPEPVDFIDSVVQQDRIDPLSNTNFLTPVFEVFPNPSADFVCIVSLNEENFNVDIFDENGKKIHTIVNSNIRYTLDVSSYSAGVYYALITVSGKAVETKKIIVTR